MNEHHNIRPIYYIIMRYLLHILTFSSHTQYVKRHFFCHNFFLTFFFQIFFFKLFSQNFFFQNFFVQHLFSKLNFFFQGFTLDASPFTETLYVSVLWKIWYIASGRNWAFVSCDVKGTILRLILLTSHSPWKVQFLFRIAQYTVIFYWKLQYLIAVLKCFLDGI